MRIWGELQTELLANLIAFCVGVCVAWFARHALKVFPAQRLWNLSNPERVMICVAASARIHTGKYSRPSTGIGQVRALAIIGASLDAAYKRINTKNIILSDEPKMTKLENDLILLGGPKNNEVSREFLKRIQMSCAITQTENEICWSLERAPLTFTPVSEEGKVKTDYGLIIRTKSPFAKGRTVCLFSGAHTYGVVAAALYFTQSYRGVLNLRKLMKQNLVAVISCEVQDDCPVNIRLEHENFF